VTNSKAATLIYQWQLDKIMARILRSSSLLLKLFSMVILSIVYVGRQLSSSSEKEEEQQLLHPVEAKGRFTIPNKDIFRPIPSQDTVVVVLQPGGKEETPQGINANAGRMRNAVQKRLAEFHHVSSENAAINETNEQPINKKLLKTPIFVVSLPKSGTTSSAAYFSCGGLRASHYWARNDDGQLRMVGECIQNNIIRQKPPLEGCGSYDVWTDTGYAEFNRCFYPSIDGLDAFYNAYPNSTLMLVTRNTSSWFHSFFEWNNHRLFRRWIRCNATGMPNNNHGKWKDFHNYYEWHQNMIRKFASDHPSMAYVEVGLESPDAGRKLEEAFGIPETCWGKCTPKFVCTFSNSPSNHFDGEIQIV
jgi:hypothetical protein